MEAKLPERIVAARKARGLTQTDLAEKLGVNRGTIVKWESGAVRPARFLPELCAALDVPIEWIVSGGEGEPPKIKFDFGVLPTLAIMSKEQSAAFKVLRKTIVGKPQHKQAVSKFLESHARGLDEFSSDLNDLVVDMKASWAARAGIPQNVREGLERIAASGIDRADLFRRQSENFQTDADTAVWIRAHQRALDEFATRVKYADTVQKSFDEFISSRRKI